MQTLKQLQSGQLKGAVSLKLSEGLMHFPPEIFDLADTLEVLDLSVNNLNALPPDFGRLQKLRIFFCSENQFTVLPEVLGHCPALDIVGFKANLITTIPPAALNSNLRWLILTNNRVALLPAQIGSCTKMQKLMLAGNRLQELPPELGNCHNLSLLRISANQLSELPQWLLTMPKLSWLAFSGNLFNKKPFIKPLTFINWDSLHLGKLLGEGASGIIFKASGEFEGESKEIAVKVFKGAVTSDGLPEDEMDTAIGAGVHPGLVKLLGQITGHPQNKKGLVMELIPASFYNLGGPPSLDSCTRDVFKAEQQLLVQQALKIAATIASLAAQLHSRGIMHGDLYAHNTLIDNSGNSLFGDFGAACFYDNTDTATAAALERLEVKAFGYLLDDLLYLCREQSNNEIYPKLAELRDACLVDEVLSRPAFRHLEAKLFSLSGR